MINLTTFIALGFSVVTIAPAFAIDLVEPQTMTIAQSKPKIDPNILIGPARPPIVGIPATSSTSSCCPPMNTKLFGTFFKRIDSGNITSPYGIKFDPVGLGLGTQYTSMLNAYQSYYTLLNYLSAGQITNLVIAIPLYGGGTGNTPVAAGAPLDQAFITFSNGPIVQPAANSFFNATLQPNVWYGIQEYSYTNISFKTNPQQAGFEESCNKQIQTWVRWQVINGRMMRQTINDGKVESVEVKPTQQAK
jgi:hypothetical protein